ncbi:hypothetical protein [Rhizobium terrae]|uniref:hypothetical protein n=1 Tax=Rhizobium terrae TaxID=2171756 RepID=UPI001966E4AD|nr:hypothetical protein [Rhizobium terrae]
MNAIAHCIGTFLSPAFNPPADGIALDGLRRARRAGNIFKFFAGEALRVGGDVVPSVRPGVRVKVR